MEQILSQDEVDALLKGIAGGEIEEPEEIPTEEEVGYTPYDFTRQQRIVQVKMPALDAINDGFMRAARTSLSSTLRRIIDLTAAPMELERFSAFLRTLPVPCSLQIFKMNPFRGHALLLMEPKLVFTLVENFLGGTGARSTRIEGRDFTAIEQKLILRVVNLLLADLQKAWKSMHPIQIQYVRSEINPQFAKICQPDDIVILNRYEIDMGRPIGSVTICIPLANLESVREKLLSSFQSDVSEEDLKIKRIVKETIRNARANFKVELGTTKMKARDILSLKKGDIVQLDQRSDEPLTCYVEGEPKFLGMPGIRKGNNSLLVRERITVRREE